MEAERLLRKYYNVTVIQERERWGGRGREREEEKRSRERIRENQRERIAWCVWMSEGWSDSELHAPAAWANR